MSKKTAKQKVVLSYSGGLDTTCLIPWLIENFNYDVICVCVDVGQEEELKDLQKRAKASGAKKLYIVDAKNEFCNDFILPCLKANAIYENEYLLGTSMARPLIGKILVDIAKKEKAVAICHGATGKGNDQIRFELAIKALSPYTKIIAPWRMTDIWKMTSREDEIEYCKKKGISLPFDSNKKSYSRDRNLWHISHEGLELEEPEKAPNYDNLLILSRTPEKAKNSKTNISITFKNGVPIKLNNKKMDLKNIIFNLNKIGGENGIGIIDIVENRVVGMKSRGVYETPAGTILIEAHKALEEMVLDRQTFEFKQIVAIKFANVVYEGKWFSPLREALSAFIDSTQENITGTVNLSLYKGNIIKNGIKSPNSLYDSNLSSFKTGDLYDHSNATGFINLFSLPEKVRAMKSIKNKKKIKK